MYGAYVFTYLKTGWKFEILLVTKSSPSKLVHLIDTLIAGEVRPLALGGGDSQNKEES